MAAANAIENVHIACERALNDRPASDFAVVQIDIVKSSIGTLDDLDHVCSACCEYFDLFNFAVRADRCIAQDALTKVIEEQVAFEISGVVDASMVPVHLAEKPSIGTFELGEPFIQSKFTGSKRSSTGAPDNVTFEKYCPLKPPVGELGTVVPPGLALLFWTTNSRPAFVARVAA